MNNYQIEDIIFDIKNNKKINNKEQMIQNALIKADILTISLDLSSKNKISELENLLNIIRKYCKEEIYLIGYNNKNTTKNFEKK